MTNVPGSSVSSVGNRTVLASIDMDMTACVTPNLPDPIPGIMITRPSIEEVPSQEVTIAPCNDVSVKTASTEDSQIKLNTSAFLKKIASGSSIGNDLPSDVISKSSNSATEDTKPKIDVSQFLAKMKSGSSKTAQENNPA